MSQVGPAARVPLGHRAGYRAGRHCGSVAYKTMSAVRSRALPEPKGDRRDDEAGEGEGEEHNVERDTPQGPVAVNVAQRHTKHDQSCARHEEPQTLRLDPRTTASFAVTAPRPERPIHGDNSGFQLWRAGTSASGEIASGLLECPHLLQSTSLTS